MYKQSYYDYGRFAGFSRKEMDEYIEKSTIKYLNIKDILKNSINDVCENIDDIIILENDLIALDIKRIDIPQENSFGLSKSSIENLVSKLNLLLERSK